MKRQLILPALLTAAYLLCACTSTEPASFSSGSSQSDASNSCQETNYTEGDVQAAFERSNSAENATILDCVVAEDQAYELMGVVQYLDSEAPETCWLGFVTSDGSVYSAGPKVQPADDDSLTYLGNGTVSMNVIPEEIGKTELYKLSYQKDGTDITYTALSVGGEEIGLNTGT